MPVESFQSGPCGGTGGNTFTDDIPADGVKIASIDIRHGNFIDAVTLNYSDSTSSGRHGGGGGVSETVTFESDEYLTEISGRYGNVVDSLLIRTNVQTFGPFGGNGGARDYRCQVPEENMEIIGLFGSSGSFLDAIGIIARQRVTAGAGLAVGVGKAKAA